MMVLVWQSEFGPEHRFFADDTTGKTYASWLQGRGIEYATRTTCDIHSERTAITCRQIGSAAYLYCDECSTEAQRLAAAAERQQRRDRDARFRSYSAQFGNYQRF